MTRTLHLWLGRTIGLLLVVLALTGTVLAVDALVEEAARPAPPPAGESVADLAAGLARHGTLAQISVTPAGAIVARFSEPRLRAVVDPTSFALAPAATPSEIVRLATEIHRTLAAGDGGRLLLAFATLCGLVSAATGFALARRGERDGGRAGRLHRGLGLAVGLPLVFSAVTGLGLAVAALRPLDVHGTAAPYPARLAEGRACRSAMWRRCARSPSPISRISCCRVATIRRTPIASPPSTVSPMSTPSPASSPAGANGRGCTASPPR